MASSVYRKKLGALPPEYYQKQFAVTLYLSRRASAASVAVALQMLEVALGRASAWSVGLGLDTGFALLDQQPW